MNKKNIVITGGTSGLGLSLVRLYVEKGHNVHCIARDEKKCITIQNELATCEGQFSYSIIDMNQIESIDQFEFDKNIDILVLNAGVGLFESFESHGVQDIKSIIHVNFLAPILLLKYCLPKLSHNATIVGITSMSAKVSTPYASIYASSKAGFYQFLNALRLETNHHIMTVNTGPIKTPFHEKAHANKNPLIEIIKLNPDKLALRILKGIEKQKIEINAPIWMLMALNSIQIAPRSIEKLIKPLLLTKQK
ncbi:SDR family oxidoreductase [Macrococcus sp. DPC7161]|uniref:SDR family NAD(P)-dependent oxidoreductase n=1 Tax=Macrococcus sp. DPC7161 TaxID=2507060 RepID=UPI00100B2FC2|nr:SDR family NAD(P)-dependent oxidoreductase [Macrococcus sp. DPC7161]RXK19312.1 SDR family NAD(P)-dependent oxidoreductase [Macrococcus sp. DPC7161]